MSLSLLLLPGTQQSGHGDLRRAVTHAAVRRQQPRCPALRFAVFAKQGGSSAAEFTPASDGRTGTAGFHSAPPAVTIRGVRKLATMHSQLQRLGLAGVAAYGIFNTLYYICAFLFFWVYVAKVPMGQGLAASAKSFAAVMAGVWAGSQVTKAPRAALALAMAPLVDRLMGLMQRVLGLKSKNAVFAVFVAACLALAAVLFGAVVLTWS